MLLLMLLVLLDYRYNLQGTRYTIVHTDADVYMSVGQGR